MAAEKNEIQEGVPVQATILGWSESREIVQVGNALALGATSSKIVLAFPQTNPKIPPRTFVFEVPFEVVQEYAECTYDLTRAAHPELNLPDRAEIPGVIQTPTGPAKTP